MTAEIAVFNSSAIALAADSAVTTTQNNMVKINNSANKLFELYKGHPVGIMIYNNASLAGSPWELLIKEFRKSITSSKDTINEYTDSLIDFLQSNHSIINGQMRLQNAQELFRINLSKINEVVNTIDFVNEMKASPIPLTVSDYYNCLEVKLDTEIQYLIGNPFYPSMDTVSDAELDSFVSGYVQEVYVRIIPIDPAVSIPVSLHNKLTEFAKLIISRVSGKNIFFTGVVIAGYGDKEYYPAVKSIHVHGVYKNKLLYTVNDDKSKSNDPYQSGIIPFAQEDEVITFIKGCSENVSVEVDKLVSNVLLEFKKSSEIFLAGKLTNQQLQDYSDQFELFRNHLLVDFRNNKDAFISANHVTKMLSMLDSLGKVDLAYMAESLIDITAFKRRITNDHETVGGPVDVAVISKGDGFVWIKRKHYFPKELNTSFFNRP
ncbi:MULTISPECIES: hypothetical protein [unclassified Tatumella]|uniref:hypothetical protein n=1 Tax=unclassified Tatumella TaxID=2649542 RepID=UPI001BAF3A6C|nr:MULTISPECIES: hypothetical protein [unclassified Tatumella]MBS0855956.1 hypothetical protein [Tatumella sp. JGM16]MBS0912935.1 hypothetical protein [Tatumella sp. JGM91]